jgi:hypothetical protein
MSTKELLKRLRTKAKGAAAWGGDMLDAADELDRLSAENQRLREALTEAAAAMRGERGATDQGEAWDQAEAILSAALEEKP